MYTYEYMYDMHVQCLAHAVFKTEFRYDMHTYEYRYDMYTYEYTYDMCMYSALLMQYLKLNSGMICIHMNTV